MSIQVGRPRLSTVADPTGMDPRHGPWLSGIFKGIASGPVAVTMRGIAGDGQADPRFHGGPDNVALAYDLEHYEYWRGALEMADLPPGSFGENFSVRDLPDETVCIGDIWRIGTGQGAGGVTMQVTQPRQPCWKLGRRLGHPQVVKMVMEKGWGGWYLRVLEEGIAEAGMGSELVERPHPEWIVQDAVWLMYRRKKRGGRRSLPWCRS